MTVPEMSRKRTHQPPTTADSTWWKLGPSGGVERYVQFTGFCIPEPGPSANLG